MVKDKSNQMQFSFPNPDASDTGEERYLSKISSFRVLLYGRYKEQGESLGRSLKAFGCQVEFCDRESSLLQNLQTGEWDVLIHEIDPTDTPKADFFSRLKPLVPRMRVILLAEKEQVPPVWQPFALEKFVHIFYKPVSADDLFRDLQTHPPGRKWEEVGEEASLLVVDSNSGFCETFLDFLLLEGHWARAVRNGQEALAEARRQFYHVALVDALIPDMIVWNLAAELHAIHPDIVVIVLADHASLDMVLKAMRADVYDYLLKPLDPLSFRRTLGKALEKQRLGLQVKALLEGLKKANQDLLRLNDLKSKFLRIVTHDLRTPLTAVKGYANALESGIIPPEQYARCFKTMSKESDQLEHLISDLTDFVSIEAGKIRLNRVPMDPRDVFQAVIERFQSTAERQKIKLQSEGLETTGSVFESERMVLADANRLDQVLSNLVGNAIKHTPAEGSIRVGFRYTDTELEVSVRDTGEGLPPEFTERVFDEFFQLESSSGKREGLGLGLAISREIVHRHGGRMGADSEGVGKGSVFWFTLPLMKKKPDGETA
ncbi:MAG TPA: hybrid sensor histidine kinase/response regulator [Elusimicrobiota bacterium]|nr:hybrid sensor histidine kinase/response regulator [Elusimicrobiota bacterium]